MVMLNIIFSHIWHSSLMAGVIIAVFLIVKNVVPTVSQAEYTI